MRINRSLALGLLALVSALALAGCGGKSAPAAGSGSGQKAAFGDVAKGKTLYGQSCASCHNADATGIPNLGKNLVKKSDWMAKQSDEQFFEFMKTGRSASDPENTTKIDMPPKGGNPALQDQDLKDIIAYIRSLQK